MQPSIAEDVETVGKIDIVPMLLEMVCRTTGMGFAAIARVTEDRWVACAVRDEIAFGLTPGGELELTTTICNEIRQSGEPVVIDHVAQDAAFCGHPTPALYGFESYISMPIVCRGAFFGTLCAIDPRPARLQTPQIVGTFRLFADLIARHIEALDRLAVSEAALIDAQDAGALREQFIAVLGHDLRNPLASIQGGTRLLMKTPLDERAQTLVGLMQNSVGRMAGLIDNILDFARARLGGGFDIERRVDPGLAAAMELAVSELRMAHPARSIRLEIEIAAPVACDSARVAQMVSNLVANALTHGADTTPVSVRARTTADAFELSVANLGPPIPRETQARLFQPFARAADRPTVQGLGLGLYIASEIARGHGGTLEVASDEAETVFTFRMPLA